MALLMESLAQSQHVLLRSHILILFSHLSSYGNSRCAFFLPDRKQPPVLSHCQS